jgi:thiol-disulfide isomerase/thioredoxin
MRAPEFPNDIRWSNSTPFTMKDIRGKKVVLIDFWTYSCVNCIRTLSHLKDWHEKYAPLGLVIVGVHTPEFEFEKDISNVQAAIKRLGISYPVILDSDYQIWSLYSNQSWPSKYLMDKDGQIVYEHAGEGDYRETEEAIRSAILDLKPKTKLPDLHAEEAQGSGGVCLPTTPELYLGSMRGHAGKFWRAVGEWRPYQEYMEHASRTEKFEDYIAVNFEASEVNLVMEAKTERPAKISLELSGKFLREIEVKEPKMYNLLNQNDFAGHKHEAAPRGELRIFIKDKSVQLYSFTFGGCV